MIDDKTVGASTVLLLEHWKPVVGFPDYQISNVGNICRSASRNSGKAWKHMRASIGKQTGYYKITLYKNGEPFTRNVHQLVAVTFIGPAPEGYTVNHIIAWKLLNWVSNFEYITRGDNVRHAYAHGLGPRGVTHPNSKLTEEDAREAKLLIKYLPHKEVARMLGVSKHCIDSISAGYNWKHIS